MTDIVGTGRDARPPQPYTPGVARTPPRTGVLDILRLAGALAGDAVRRRRDFSARLTFRRWARATAERHRSDDVVLDFGVKRVLLVGSPAVSAQILAAPPSDDGFVAGALKRDAMAFLAPHALTIADGDAWTRLRAYNERVLEPGRPHDHADVFVRRVRDAFREPVSTPDDVRAAMGRAMLGVVFGAGVAPASLADDVTALFGYVQSPVKRLLLGALGRRRRARFYDELRRACDAAAASGEPSLVGLSRRGGADRVADVERVEQVPHWMFTFTGSGTDLVTRTLALVSAHPDARRTALGELAAVGVPVADAARVGALAYLRACLRETADLYPPVTRTVHRAPHGAVVAGVAVPAGMDVLHVFPPVADDAAVARRFRPERWLAPDAPRPHFDPFLGGARACPGRDLITLVCAAALAALLGEQRLTLDGAPLAADALPAEFPRRGVRFRPA